MCCPQTPPSKDHREDHQGAAKPKRAIGRTVILSEAYSLDPSARKRLNSNDYGVVPPKKKSVVEGDESNDILRRRLLAISKIQTSKIQLQIEVNAPPTTTTHNNNTTTTPKNNCTPVGEPFKPKGQNDEAQEGLV
ncbi:hypothetical protein TCAL_14718 [Tigriopus californicus]|uniref:Uncharacterized protein n=1 Tax=Tigriopus californicus TaxID=6832 RepID=A0A553PF11_TIGCA|nr:hypothetical protein TCAL_14718 [Tigriopus californicus]